MNRAILIIKRITVLMLFFLFYDCSTELQKKGIHYSPLAAVSGLFKSSSFPSVSSVFTAADFTSLENPSPVVISKTRKLGLSFLYSMSSSCSLTFNGTVYSSVNELSSDKKTLFFSPVKEWPLNVELPLTLNVSGCISEGGQLLSVGTGISVYIAEKVIYTDSLTGSDSNVGTDASPLLTIQAGLNSASAGCTDRCAAAVKGGTYPVTLSILVPPNISLFGGFDPADWRKRRADKTSSAPYDTVITDSSTGVIGTGTDPYATVKFYNHTGSKDKSIIDGIIVNGPVSANAGSFVAPIGAVHTASGAGFTIRNTVTSDLSTTVSVTSAGFVSSDNSGEVSVENSSFSGSSVSAASSIRYGIVYSLFNSGSSLSVKGSDLKAGISSANSAGFFPTGAVKAGNVSLSRNTITGPTCSGCTSVGITADFTAVNSMTVSENTVISGAGTDSFGINVISGSGLSILKNSITAMAGTVSSKGITSGAAAANLSISGNTVSSGSAGANGSTPVILYQSSGTHTVSDNTLSSGSCSAGGCVSAALQTSSSMSTVITGNTLSGGVCTGAPCVSAGIYFDSSGTHTVSGNTFSGSGSCSTANCYVAGIYNVNTAGVNTFNISNNTVYSGSCSNTSCKTGGIINNLPGISSGIHTWNISTNTVSAGVCSAGSCEAYGFFTNDYHANGSALNFTNNVITTANCTGGSCNTYGFGSSAPAVRSATVTMTGNTVAAGNAASQSSGISIVYNAATFNIDSNIISSGTAGTTWGVNDSFSSGFTFTNNTVTAGASLGTQIGFRMAANGASLTVTGNTVDSGSSSGSTAVRTAFSLEQWPNNAVVQRNTFLNRAGIGAPASVNIPNGSGNTLKFCSNVLVGGGTSAAGPQNTLVLGPSLSAAAAFWGNTIIAPTVGSGPSHPVNFTVGTGHPNLSLNQNLIAGEAASASVSCVRENAAGISYLSFQFNNLSSCGVTYYNRNGTLYNTHCSGNFGQGGCGSVLTSITTSASNQVSTPVFINSSGNDFHLHSSTPAAITQGITGVEVTNFNAACGNSLDRDGNTRTANSAIGAYK